MENVNSEGVVAVWVKEFGESGFAIGKDVEGVEGGSRGRGLPLSWSCKIHSQAFSIANISAWNTEHVEWSLNEGAGFSRGMSEGRRSETPRSFASSISATALILSGRGVSCAKDMEVTVLQVRKPWVILMAKRRWKERRRSLTTYL